MSSYRLLYRIADEVVLVTAFVHGARDLACEREGAASPAPRGAAESKTGQ